VSSPRPLAAAGGGGTVALQPLPWSAAAGRTPPAGGEPAAKRPTRVPTAKTLEENGWDEAAEGDGTETADTSWLDRKWEVAGLKDRDGGCTLWSLNAAQALEKGALRTRLLEQIKKKRIAQAKFEKRRRETGQEKRGYVKDGNATTKYRRLSQPSRKPGYKPPAHRAQRDGDGWSDSDSETASPAPTAGRTATNPSTTAKGVAQKEKRGAVKLVAALYDLLSNISDDARGGAFKRALRHDRIAPLVKDCPSVLDVVDEKIFNVLIEGCKAVRELCAARGADVFNKGEHCGMEAEKLAQRVALANLVELGKQACKKKGLPSCGEKAIRESLLVSTNLQTEVRKRLNKVYSEETVALSLNLFRERSGAGVTEEAQSSVVEFVSEHLMEIPGKMTTVKSQVPDPENTGKFVVTKRAVSTCGLRDTHANLYQMWSEHNKHLLTGNTRTLTSGLFQKRLGLPWL
jgi:hypothetical protein